MSKISLSGPYEVSGNAKYDVKIETLFIKFMSEKKFLRNERKRMQMTVMLGVTQVTHMGRLTQK